MGNSVLITGGTKNERVTDIENRVGEYVNAEIRFTNLGKYPDIRIVTLEEDKKSIGIQQAKDGATFLSEKPFFWNYKFLIFLNSGKLTTEAQNSLLKTLEEPPAYAHIFLECQNENMLLDTVQSRCKKVKLRKKYTYKNDKDNEYITYKDYEADLNKIIDLPLGERLVIAEKIGNLDKEEIFELIQYWTHQMRKELLENKNNIAGENLNKIMTFREDIEKTNVSVKFGVENLFLRLA